MPTNTFFNLSAAKQERIWDAAVAEFAAYPFAQASVNRITKAAGIAHGSFYQYFANKLDLYKYVIERISKEKYAIYSGFIKPLGELGFLDGILAAFPSIFAWANAKPEYNKIGMHLSETEPSEILELFADNSVVNYFIELLEKERVRGEIREDIDLGIVLNLISFMGTFLLKDYYSGQDIIKRFEAFIKILRHGISTSDRE
jgi:AcrR family transcriptional regulator